MEISKSLQEEIVSVQNKLQKAILEHQTCVGKSKDDPNNSAILGQIQQIQLHIISLGRSQKQIVQRLRKEVEAFKADNANGSKISIPSLLGLNNNNHITNNNETKHEAAVENGFETKSSKEDYEEVVRNGDVHRSPEQENDCAKLCPSSVETISNEDDVMEMSMDENSNEKQEEMQQEEQDDAESAEQQSFMYILGLITKSKFIELQNKRVERKRRSTANPQFVYSMLEQPSVSKRKRHTYLQSGNAPHTRQTTARMNGPSPPPLSKPQPTKSTSTSPPAQTVTKSLIPIQRSITRPNILRNTDSKVFVNKSKAEDNQTRSSVPSAKSIQSISNKTVHIPGLPSSLTIERIENDSIVCICCRNPGILTVCKNCSNNYHISCHIRSSAPARICPKCVLTMDEDEDVKDEVAEIESQVEEENKLPRCKKDEKFEEKQRERYELRERNSDLRMQVYELEKRSQLLGQSFQLQQRLHQELLGKQEKTQKSIKRLVDFIKLIQARKNTSSPVPSASTSCPPQPSSSRSPQTTPPPQSSTNQKAANSLPSSIPNNDSKTSCPATLTISTSIHDRASPTFKQEIKCLAPTNCPVAPSSKKNINHISLSKQSNRLGGAISLVTVKPTTKTTLPPLAQVTTFSSSQAKASPGATTSVKSKSVKESHRYTVSLYQNCQILLPRTSITWTERPSMAESPGPSSHVENSVSISQPDSPQRTYCLSTATPKTTMTSKYSTDQSQPDQQKRQEQQRTSTVVVNTEQEPALSCTQFSQTVTSPIPSPVVYASHEASAQTTETIRSSDSSSAAQCTNLNPENNQTISQQQSSSSGALSRDSSST
ncbi:cyclin-dependent kinase 12-like isoform X3 [Pseudomyrmex gracilis]|uniref:cyclin-dependent kinase 12-like isoform X3 n=1 Tax=Pseudomyrmex gracilis TaxID=219809 RepID=UPI000995441B|nr:cyclin-dependent kinase 12-like isoform X3 [Pseudomyrmex gracilis]